MNLIIILCASVFFIVLITSITLVENFYNESLSFSLSLNEIDKPCSIMIIEQEDLIHGIKVYYKIFKRIKMANINSLVLVVDKGNPQNHVTLFTSLKVTFLPCVVKIEDDNKPIAICRMEDFI